MPDSDKKVEKFDQKKTMEAASGGLHGFFLVPQRSKVYELSRTGVFFPTPDGFLVKLYPRTITDFPIGIRFGQKSREI